MNHLTIGVRKSGRVWLPILFIAWFAAVLGLWAWLTTYSLTPGAKFAPPDLRSVRVPFETTGNRHLLVMAIHPKCPCSRASVGELARLASRFRDELNCVVLTYQPHEQSADWIETDLVASARGLPNTMVLIDVDGRDAAALGMNTSGAVVLYSPQGVPQFWGGITIGRGHYGDNLGSDAVISVLDGGQLPQASQPVYGCRIQSDPEIDTDSPQRQGADDGH